MNRKKIYTEVDVTCDLIKNTTVGIIGYGSQAKAQALNLKDSGANVIIGLRKGSNSIQLAKKDGFQNITSIKELCHKSNIISVLIPDEEIPNVYEKSIKNYLSEGKTILFSHGYCVHFNKIVLPKNINIIMVAPSGAGKMVRQEFINGRGIPNLIAVHQDFTNDAFNIALSYSHYIGGTKVGSFVSTFKEEVVTDLFGEQAILTGGIPSLIKESFNTLVNKGYSPIVAWFVCYYEVKAIIDLFYDKGFEYLNNSISNIAEYGGFTRGDFLIDDNFKDKLSIMIDQIETGEFDKEWMLEKNNKKKLLNAKREETLDSDIEKITKKLLSKINFDHKK
ncbi:MAG: ketol-acid reductoisomerase [Candidatus Pelagibacter sp. TMED166]|nr:MAG: ketol-acid reductoisomerase [Candidatus Pelagibacter sp. TMED166]|tara:strand:+ start:7515 stop:8519 length:1005 start_codon:yes stop_codon:yes gene_type:complete